MIGVMTLHSRAVVQFVLPFDGLRDRVRNLAAAGKVYIMPRAMHSMRNANVNDVIMTRALRRCELLSHAKRGSTMGEWVCIAGFNARGFRQGGAVTLTLSEGRIFVEDISWDPQP